MPVKKSLPDAPVIFTLTLPSEETDPSGFNNTTDYYEIIKDVEQSHISQRFNTETMKEILTKIKSPSYSSNTCCFWCCNPFSWQACVLPISYDSYENMYACEGHFCSPECALAYLYEDVHISDVTRWTRHALLSDLYRDLYKDKILTPAPHRHLLRMFGGQLDIEQFREYVCNSEDLVNIQLPPLRLHVPSMNVQGPVRDVKKFVALSQETVEKASKELRLRRNKPVHITGATLDQCILSSR